jgi:RecB family exonuclease
VITPRRTRLYRAPQLSAFRTTLTGWMAGLSPEHALDTFVVVPTGAAAEQLRRTVEDRILTPDRSALLWARAGTLADLYDDLASRLGRASSLLSPFGREVILGAVARRLVDEGITPPFRIRAGLIAEMLALYDQIRRLGRSIDDFERNFLNELEPEQHADRGAARLLQQTEFLTAAYRGYEQQLAESGRLDEHTLRRVLLDVPPRRPLRTAIITVADRVAESNGLWPADFDLLTRLPGLQHLDVLCTESVLAAGFLERLHAALPDLADVPLFDRDWTPPHLVAPAGAGAGDPGPVSFTYRDREEELSAVARRLKADRRAGGAAPLHRTAIVVRRPLPYLYLARQVFNDAGVPFETLDTLPLAAEPYAAAVDLVLDAVASDFGRSSLLALLRTPHFRLAVAGRHEAISAASIAACDVALATARYAGGLDRLHALVSEWGARSAPTSRDERRQQVAWPAARAVLDAVRLLAPLAGEQPMVRQIDTLVDWLRVFDEPAAGEAGTRTRRRRVRGAVLGALTALRDAYAAYDPEALGRVDSLTAAMRRWLGSQTFATRSGEAGVQILDAQAARYGDFDDLQVAGLIDGEWPERVRRNVLYPSSLMVLLEPLAAAADPTRRERDALHGARASFKDLILSPARRVRVSTFLLENDAIVEPSILLDEVPGLLPGTVRDEQPPLRVSHAEALAMEPRRPDVISAGARRWAAARLTADDRGAEHFRGEAGHWRLPRVSVSRLERYLDCPFRFFASEVLGLEEEPEDEDTRTPLERGRFLHELWERFFAAWQARGHGRVEPDQLGDARALFETLCEEALAHLPRAEAALERSRLLGSAVNPGIAHRVFTMEADRPDRIVERLLEFPLQGAFTFHTLAGEPRVVTVSAKADRIDLLADGGIRVIDYKSRNTPDQKQALQLPIYSYIARESLRRARGGSWAVAEAMYLSFEGPKAVVPLRARGRTLDEVMADAQDRLLGTLDRIAAGHFPPQPARKSMCASCAFPGVCRLDHVEPAAPESGSD